MTRWMMSFPLFAAGCINASEAAPVPAADSVGHAERGAQTTAAEASITGTVTWHGAHPAMPAFVIPPASAACGTSAPFFALMIGPGEGVANAIVTIVGGNHPPVVAGSATIDQRGCSFEPHVVAAPVGSRITFANHDAVLHSIHAFRGSVSDFNLATPPNFTLGRALTTPGLLHIQCDTGHTWMSSWLDIVDTPWYSVSDAHGRFHIDHVPPGTYTVQMWHEGWHASPSTDGHPAYSAPVVRTATVTIAPGATAATHDFALQ